MILLTQSKSYRRELSTSSFKTDFGKAVTSVTVFFDARFVIYSVELSSDDVGKLYVVKFAWWGGAAATG